jgi:hypothetical protein
MKCEIRIQKSTGQRLKKCWQLKKCRNQATVMNPNDPNYFFNRGNAYLTVKNVEQVLHRPSPLNPTQTVTQKD